MAAWQGREENRPTGVSPPGRCNGAATRGEYADAMEAA